MGTKVPPGGCRGSKGETATTYGQRVARLELDLEPRRASTAAARERHFRVVELEQREVAVEEMAGRGEKGKALARGAAKSRGAMAAYRVPVCSGPFRPHTARTAATLLPSGSAVSRSRSTVLAYWTRPKRRAAGGIGGKEVEQSGAARGRGERGGRKGKREDSEERERARGMMMARVSGSASER